MIPDDVVGLLEAGALGSGDELGERRHEGGDLLLAGHAAHAVVAARHDAEQLAVGCAVLGDGDGGVAGRLAHGEHVRERRVRRDVRVGADEARLIALHARDHRGLVLDRLRAVDEADAALLREGDGELVAGNGLHNGGDHRHVQVHRGLLDALAVAHERRAQGDIFRPAFQAGIARHEQIFIKGMRSGGEEVCHSEIPPYK